MQFERGADGVKNSPTVDDAQIRVHATAEAFERGREMPLIVQLTVDRRLVADGIKTRPV